jgi:L-2-amino-thiazoline-4-carboxylic acid hydrolase
MNIKLFLLSIWVPEFVLIQELERTCALTNEYLDRLLNRYSITPPMVDTNLKGNFDERRKMMAAGHNLRVKALVDALGSEKALEAGRSEMFKAGYKMGCEVHKRLGLGEDIKEAVVAAKILYKVLGIKFTIEKRDKNIFMRVKSCALSSQYTPHTCKIMSAADEGVLKGLNEKMDLKFRKRITEGAEECTACVNIKN